MNIPKYKVKIGMGEENVYFVLDYQIKEYEYRTSIQLKVPEQWSDKIRDVIIVTPATIFIEEVDGWPINSETLLKFEGLKNIY